MTFSTRRQENLEPVEVTEMSWINDMTRLERQSASTVSYQKTYPYNELNSLITHKVTPVEQHETARHPQSVHVTSIPESPTRGMTTIASASTRHDPNHREIQSWHESPTRGDRLEEWFSETSHTLRRQEDMRSEARRFVDVDDETKRASRALRESVGQSGSDRWGTRGRSNSLSMSCSGLASGSKKDIR